MKKIIALICVLCCVFLCACGGGQAEESTPTTGGAENVPKNIVLANGKTAAYDVVIPHDCSDELKSTASGLAQKLQTATGALFRVTSDASPAPANKGEIIIGFCSRNETEVTLEGMLYRDYRICVTDKNIIIGAYCEDAAIEGVFRFMSLFKDENLQKDAESTTLLWQEDISYNHTYSIPNANVNGIDIGEYRIVIPESESKNDTFVSLAEKLQAMLGNYTGRYLDIVNDSMSSVEYELLLGKTNRAQSESATLMKYSVSVIDSKIAFAAGGSFSLSRAIDDYESKLIQSDGVLGEAVASKSFIDKYPANQTSEYRLMQYNVLVEFEGWGSGKGNLVSDVDIRREIVASTVLGYSPDVIVMCELYDKWRESLVPMIESEYTGVCLDRKEGVSNTMPIFYKKDKFTLIDSGYTDIDDVVGSINRRVVTWAVLKDKVTDKQLIVFGTHLSSVASAGASLSDRQCAEVNKILPVMNSVTAKYSGSVIFMGDFNSTTNTKTYNHIKSTTGLTGITESEASRLGIVDHIFADSSVTANKFFINFDNCGDYASDHRPVVCDVNIGK